MTRVENGGCGKGKTYQKEEEKKRAARGSDFKGSDPIESEFALVKGKRNIVTTPRLPNLRPLTAFHLV